MTRLVEAVRALVTGDAAEQLGSHLRRYHSLRDALREHDEEAKRRPAEATCDVCTTCRGMVERDRSDWATPRCRTCLPELESEPCRKEATVVCHCGALTHGRPCVCEQRRLEAQKYSPLTEVVEQEVAGSTPAVASTVGGSRMPPGEWGVDPAAKQVGRKSDHFSEEQAAGNAVADLLNRIRKHDEALCNEMHDALNRYNAIVRQRRPEAQNNPALTQAVEPREGNCECCGRDYAVWVTTNALWNSVVRERTGAKGSEPFLCASCFALQAETQGTRPTAWVLVPETPGMLPMLVGDPRRSEAQSENARLFEQFNLGLETGAEVVDKQASIHRMRAQSFADDSDRADGEAQADDIEREEKAAEMLEYVASRIRAMVPAALRSAAAQMKGGT